ncbi:ABC transporter permease [Butyricimonas sp. RTP31023st2_F12_RTP31023_210422]|uniref:ABC transporter permease n=1 Tax=Butyricimonas sp. RTP31023st2_F12_RTP31023_210422 TaxID=3143211 RepID=UPI0034A2F76D
MKLKTFIDQFLAFTRKEFFHILRDRKTLLVLVVLPISQLLIFGFALNSSLAEMPTAVLDMSNDRMSRQIVSEIDASSTFKIVEYVSSMQEVDELFKSGKLSLVLVFMPGFEREIKRTGKGNMQVIMDASLQINASTLESYILATLLTYQQKINAGRELPIQIIPEVKMRYNPRLNSAFHFVPGVIGIVLMLVCSMMASLAIVKEKESGTMEVLLVSPVRPPVIILAKLMPYLLIGMINIVVILLISVFVLKVPVAGNIFLLFFVGTIFTLSSLALGIMVSVLTKTQRSAIIISIAGLMLPAITLSGFIFPLDSLSMGMKVIVHAMPVTLFISSARNIMIKGLGMEAVYPELCGLVVITVVLIAISIKCFKNRLS